MLVKIRRTPHREREKQTCVKTCGKEFEQDGFQKKAKLCTVPFGLPTYLDTIDVDYPKDYLVETKD